MGAGEGSGQGRILEQVALYSPSVVSFDSCIFVVLDSVTYEVLRASEVSRDDGGPRQRANSADRMNRRLGGARPR